MSNAIRWQKPPRWQALAAAAAAALIFGYLRLVHYSHTIVPLSYGLPLLLTLWHRDRTLHYVLAIVFTLMATIKAFFIVPDLEINPLVVVSMNFLNIWIPALVIDWLILIQTQLRNANESLTEANAELEASNEELAAREEEISSQNEELQRQTEEMEHQMEELQEQSEELQQQSEELQELQLLATSRGHVLQSLFNISTGLGMNGEVHHVFTRICEATAQAFGDSINGAVLLEREGEELVIRGRCGLEDAASLMPGALLNDAFIRTVVERGETACVEDLQKTPDILAPAAGGQPVRAVIAAPLFEERVARGAIVVYSATPREWTQMDFQTAEWLAAQGSLLLAAIGLQEELDRRSRDAEDASHRKTQFLAAVSHDVRTPANAINLMAEVLEQARSRPELAAEVPVMIARLRENTKQLVELVSDVLDISRLDCGKIDLERNEFDFGKLIAGELRHYQPLADIAGLSLECELPQQPVWICTDRMKLIRVIENLIGNAIKFTERGSVIVKVTLTNDGLELHVNDTGVGIPHDKLEHIFDEFFQVSNPERDRSKGSGLGLAICRRLVDALGCSLSVRSRLGEGSTFIIRMPDSIVIGPPTDEPVRLSPATKESLSLSGLRVLLVEDHESTRIAMGQLLTLHGAHIEHAADARTAIQLLRRCEPDVLLLDLMLPDMDGREVLRQLQSHRPAQLRCVLVVSGDVTHERRQEALALGADGIVSKPIEIGPLAELIQNTLRTFSPTGRKPALDRH
jgi:signal transduction histidine kinase/response regulator RpfG family c-di-GMP phosphodiesterase